MTIREANECRRRRRRVPERKGQVGGGRTKNAESRGPRSRMGFEPKYTARGRQRGTQRQPLADYGRALRGSGEFYRRLDPIELGGLLRGSEVCG